MIYLSAQPAEYYFLWQLEIQLFNFSRFNIDPENMHILFGYRPETGLDGKFTAFVESNRNKASFYFYHDTRPETRYISTIRPHIIKKHFDQFPYLERETIFYHDSDIIFKDLPDFQQLLHGSTWYFSDTRGYISAEFIKSFGPAILTEMCNLINIDPGLVIQNIANSGGAQYLIKNIHQGFWEKHERDSHLLYEFLTTNKERFKRVYAKMAYKNEIDFKKLQTWCADMWSFLWNSLAFGKNVAIHSELDFCWATSPIADWDNNKIFHNAGVQAFQSHELFYKTDYKSIAPFDEDLSFVRPDYCSIKYVDELKEYLTSQRVCLEDVTFLFIVRITSNEMVSDLISSVKYIRKYLDTNIVVVECDDSPKLPCQILHGLAEVIFERDTNVTFDTNYFFNKYFQKVQTAYIALYDHDLIINPQYITACVKVLRETNRILAYPYSGTMFFVKNTYLKEMFEKTLNISVLENDWQAVRREKLYIRGAILAKGTGEADIENAPEFSILSDLDMKLTQHFNGKPPYIHKGVAFKLSNH